MPEDEYHQELKIFYNNKPKILFSKIEQLKYGDLEANITGYMADK